MKLVYLHGTACIHVLFSYFHAVIDRMPSPLPEDDIGTLNLDPKHLQVTYENPCATKP